MLKILVCEDDQHIAEMIRYVLSDNYDITIAYNGSDAIEILEEEAFHLIITDIIMPKVDGYQFLDYLKDVDDKTPVIILSSLNSATNQIDGYKYEIEDYIVKPFNAELFKRKIDIIATRLFSLSDSDLEIDEGNRTVKIGDETVDFTPIEFNVFYHLYINKGKYCNKYDILLLFWNSESNDRVVDYTIKRIRKKLGAHASCIVTKSKVGYKYEQI